MFFLFSARKMSHVRNFVAIKSIVFGGAMGKLDTVSLPMRCKLDPEFDSAVNENCYHSSPPEESAWPYVITIRI
jgi:hypothetical protein